MINRLRAFWPKVPFRHMTVMVVALFVIKEQFPFSNFPMYSNFDTEADVVYIADQKGSPVSMDAVFRSGSSTAKKAYKKELGKLTQPSKRDTKEATADERAAAGKIVLGDWYSNMRKERLPAGTTAIRIYRRTFELKNGKLSDEEIAWKADGTRTYQELTRRCLATLVETTPLTAIEPDRKRIEMPDVIPLTELKKRGA